MTPNLDWRWIFIMGLVAGAVLADATYPQHASRATNHAALAAFYACETDAECEAECLLKSEDAEDCGVEL